MAVTPDGKTLVVCSRLNNFLYAYSLPDLKLLGGAELGGKGAGWVTLTPDGKFSNARSGGEIETGTWAQEGDLSCLTPDEGDKRCYTFTQPDAEGNFTGTTPEGVTVTVRKTA